MNETKEGIEKGENLEKLRNYEDNDDEANTEYVRNLIGEGTYADNQNKDRQDEGGAMGRLQLSTDLNEEIDYDQKPGFGEFRKSQR